MIKVKQFGVYKKSGKVLIMKRNGVLLKAKLNIPVLYFKILFIEESPDNKKLLSFKNLSLRNQCF
jgi:hypothetical protein